MAVLLPTNPHNAHGGRAFAVRASRARQCARRAGKRLLQEALAKRAQALACEQGEQGDKSDKSDKSEKSEKSEKKQEGRERPAERGAPE